MVTMVEAIHQACLPLKREYGDAPIPARLIRERVEVLRGRRPGAGLPADGCYNRANTPIGRPGHPLFEYVAKGLYRYLGPDYRYTGFVLHCDKTGVERIVGRWEDGQLAWYGENGPELPK